MSPNGNMANSTKSAMKMWAAMVAERVRSSDFQWVSHCFKFSISHEHLYVLSVCVPLASSAKILPRVKSARSLSCSGLGVMPPGEHTVLAQAV
jgi:hypothetical protein